MQRDVRQADLEQAIRDSEDDSARENAWAILADHLQASGDERGQLWALERALAAMDKGSRAAATPERRLPMIRQRNRIHGAHVGAWLGPLIAELDRDPASSGAYTHELAALRGDRASWSQLRYVPRLFHQQEPSIQLAWRAGFVTDARIRGPDGRVASLSRALLSCPASSLLTCLDIACDSLDAGARNLRGPNRLASVHSLRLRASAPGRWELGWLRESAPNLTRLAVNDPDLRAFAHPRLRSLQCAGTRADQVLGGLDTTDLPALRRLHIGSFTSIGDNPDLSGLADAAGIPRVDSLRLGRMRIEIEEPLCAALVNSALLRRISRFEIEWLNDRPDTRAWLDAHRAALGRIQVFDIREHGELFCARL